MATKCSAKESKWKIGNSDSDSAPRQNNSALHTKVEPEVNPIAEGMAAVVERLHRTIHFIGLALYVKSPASPILGIFRYSALDLHCTSLQSYISLSVVLFLMNNPQNIFGLLSSRHLALFHPSQVLSAGSRNLESCSK